MIRCLPSIYNEIAQQRCLPLGDFPDPRMMQQLLAPLDFSTFKPLDPQKLEALEHLLTTDLPKLLQVIPEEQARVAVAPAAISQVCGSPTPFAVMKVGGASEQSVYQSQWFVPPVVAEYEADFEALNPRDGKLTGEQAKDKMVESHLPSNVLHRIWALADVDNDGLLAKAEYALAMHLIKMKLSGQDLPITLPPEMLPEELRDVQEA